MGGVPYSEGPVCRGHVRPQGSVSLALRGMRASPFPGWVPGVPSCLWTSGFPLYKCNHTSLLDGEMEKPGCPLSLWCPEDLDPRRMPEPEPLSEHLLPPPTGECHTPGLAED